jgi:hypothetical protein
MYKNLINIEENTIINGKECDLELRSLGILLVQASHSILSPSKAPTSKDEMQGSTFYPQKLGVLPG